MIALINEKQSSNSLMNIVEEALTSSIPLIKEMRTDLIVIPSAKIRRERLDRRTGFVPTFEQFDREEKAYAAASMDINPICGNLPTVEDIVSAMK
jgi:hypothetical protein